MSAVVTFADKHPKAFAFERGLERHLAGRFPVARANEGGFAPRMYAYDCKLVLPDILCIVPRGSYPYWVDAKFKTEAPRMEVWDCSTTGIDLPRLRDYERVERHTGMPVFLVFGHEAENEVRTTPLTGWRHGIGDNWGRMAYWDFGQLALYPASYREILEAPEPVERVPVEHVWHLFSEYLVQRPFPGLEG